MWPFLLLHLAACRAALFVEENLDEKNASNQPKNNGAGMKTLANKRNANNQTDDV